MSDNTKSKELVILKNWHLKLLILAGILAPAVSGMSAYFGIKERALLDKVEITKRLSDLELEVNKNYADKASIQSIDTRVRRMELDLAEIKFLLKSKLK